MYSNGIMLKPALAARAAEDVDPAAFDQPAAPPNGMETTPPMDVNPNYNEPATPEIPGMDTTPDIGVTPEQDFNQPATPAPPGSNTTPDIGVSPEPDFNEPATPAPPWMDTTPDIGVSPEPDFNEPATPAPPWTDTTPDIGVTPEPDFNQPATPAPPGVDTTPDIGVTPEQPSFPPAGFCNVRFLFAAINTPPVNITFGTTPIVNGFSFGQITAYTMELAGLRTITIRNSSYPYSIINQSAFRFRQGRIYTIALLNSPGGLVLYLIEDTNCNRTIYQSCIRAVNLTYDVPNVDFSLADGRVLFSNVSYAAITNYRQIMQGTYTFVASDRSQCPMPIANANGSRVVQIIPIVIGGSNPNPCTGNTLLSGNFYIMENIVYTLYLIGSAYDYPSLKFVLAESIFNS